MKKITKNQLFYDIKELDILEVKEVEYTTEENSYKEVETDLEDEDYYWERNY